jgi:hypothetical protein
MQHCSGLPGGHDRQMQQSFGTGSTVPFDYLSFAVDHDQIGWLQATLFDPTGCHQQCQGLALQYTAEVAAGAITPAAPINGRHHLTEP